VLLQPIRFIGMKRIDGGGLKSFTLCEQDLVNRYDSRTAPGKGAFQHDKILFGPDINDFQISDRLGIPAVLPGHPFALGDLGWPGAAADRPRSPVTMTTVGFPSTAKSVAFDYPGKSPSFGYAGDIDLFADGEDIGSDGLPRGIVLRVLHPHFFQRGKTGIAALAEVSV